MINRILVPLDGSKLAEGVLPYVEDIAKRMNAQVSLVQVVQANAAHEMWEALTPGTLRDEEEDTERQVKAARDYLSELAGVLKSKGIESSVEVVVTNRLLAQMTEPGWHVGMEHVPSASTPASRIVELSHSLGADMIAMSTHGRSGLSRVFFGSVADEVLRESGIPVLLIRTVRAPKGVVDD